MGKRKQKFLLFGSNECETLSKQPKGCFHIAEMAVGGILERLIIFFR